VIDTVKRVSGVDFRVDFAAKRPGDPAQIVAKSDRIRQTLGWRPQFHRGPCAGLGTPPPRASLLATSAVTATFHRPAQLRAQKLCSEKRLQFRLILNCFPFLAIRFLCSKAASYVTGKKIQINGHLRKKYKRLRLYVRQKLRI
jgi:hypothetical protein